MEPILTGVFIVALYKATELVWGKAFDADEAAKLVLTVARDETVDAGVRSYAAQALGQLGRADEAAELLLALARHAQVDDLVRYESYWSLKRLVAGG